MYCLFSIFACQFPQFPSVVAFQFNTNLVKGHTLYDFNGFKFIDVCFLACHIIYIESSISTLEECAFCYCWVEFSINVLICLFKHKPSSLKISYDPYFSFLFNLVAENTFLHITGLLRLNS